MKKKEYVVDKSIKNLYHARELAALFAFKERVNVYFYFQGEKNTLEFAQARDILNRLFIGLNIEIDNIHTILNEKIKRIRLISETLSKIFE